MSPSSSHNLNTETLLIGIEITQHCNLRCVHCLRADTHTRKDMPLALVKKILRQAKMYKHPHIAFTGGEPTLHRQFSDVLQSAYQQRFEFHFISNGQNLATLLPELKTFQPYLRAISISLDGASALNHDQIRGQGSFKKALMAIALAKYQGFGVAVQCAINKINRSDIRALVSLCTDLGVDRLYFSHSQPTPILYQKQWLLTPTQWKQVEGMVQHLAKKGNALSPRMAVGTYDPGRIAPCWTLSHSAININVHGQLSFCCQLSGTHSSESDEDIVADLKQFSLANAHQKHLILVQKIIQERISALSKNRFDDRDHFQCWYCFKRFAKVKWMHAYPLDPWVKNDPYFQTVT